MMGAKRWAASAAILTCLAAGAVLADGLTPGASLEYNKPYMCGGERIVVGRCRDDSNDSYCQVRYIDRPPRNGFEIETVEQRGEVIKKLQSCPAAQQPQAQSRPQSTPPAASPPAKPAPPAASASATPKAKPATAKVLGADFCPKLTQVIAAGAANFKPIDLGPDSKSSIEAHKAAVIISGADCYLEGAKGKFTYICIWPQETNEDKLEDEFVEIGGALVECTHQKPDQDALNDKDEPSVIVVANGVEAKLEFVTDFLSLDVSQVASAKAASTKGASPQPKKGR